MHRQPLRDLEWLLGALADDGDHALGRALLLAAVFPGYQGSFGRMLARRGSQPMWRLYPTGGTWLARRPRRHIHFTPTYASWLNQVKRFFALITQRAIRRDAFESTADLVKKIDRFIRTHNKNSRPFVWTATANSILQKLARLCQRISGTEH